MESTIKLTHPIIYKRDFIHFSSEPTNQPINFISALHFTTTTVIKKENESDKIGTGKYPLFFISLDSA